LISSLPSIILFVFSRSKAIGEAGSRKGVTLA
jgi:hypothetical protein